MEIKTKAYGNYVKTVEYKSSAKRLARIENFKKYKALYLMAIPGILYFMLFKYLPMAGLIISFQNYNVFKGFFGSEFVKFQNYQTLFSYGDFWLILKNTLLLNFYDLVIAFPIPILLALLINEVKNTAFKRTVQLTIYLPHFLSWSILGGIMSFQILSTQTGIVNQMIQAFGGEPIFFMTKPEYAKSIAVIIGIWKSAGWGTIIYLAAMSGINPSLYEASIIDGAGKLKQMFYITIPMIMPVVVIKLLLQIGHFMDFGFERIWVIMNGANRGALDIIDTYMYKTGLLEGRFSYATAISVFKATVGLILILSANSFSKKTTGESLF